MECVLGGMEEFPVRTVEGLCLGTSLAISGFFYYVYRKKRKTVDKLNVSSLPCPVSIPSGYGLDSIRIAEDPHYRAIEI